MSVSELVGSWYTCNPGLVPRPHPGNKASITLTGKLVSLVPSPTPSFSSLLSTVKRGGPGTSSHVSDVKGRKG